MTNSLQVNELMGELTGRTVEAFSLWADANQKVLRELVDLSAGTAREGVRLYAEIQSATLEAVKKLRKGNPIPDDTFGQRGIRNRLDVSEIPCGDFAIVGLAGRDANAAITHHDARNAVPRGAAD